MLPTDLPELAIVVVLTDGGPYLVGDAVSVAFACPTVGRLVGHAQSQSRGPESASSFVPETISARVVHPAPPYEIDDVITLSFVDPSIARIHRVAERETKSSSSARERWTNEDASQTIEPELQTRGSDTRVEDRRAAPAFDEPTEHLHARDDRRALVDAPNETNGRYALHRVAPSEERSSTSSGETHAGGVRVLLRWHAERARRFVQVVDKLFTVDRLGWYRHAFAMRLLIPDEISCGDAVADVEAMRHLVTLRVAAVEMLGRPLLAAFMPNFSITSEWLESLDDPIAARAMAGLRDAIAPCVRARNAAEPSDDPLLTTGVVDRQSFEDQPTSTIESMLPMFIASDSKHAELGAHLHAYRRGLCDVFAQTATSVDAVRLGGMAQPNHSLDDRLWQLVGVVGVTLDGLPVA